MAEVFNTVKGQFNRLIISTSLITLGAAFVVFSYGTFAFGLMFPHIMADFNSDLGSHRAAAMFRERIYRSNPTVHNLYMTLDAFIRSGNNKKVIIYSELMFDEENYHAYIDQRNKQ